MIIAVVSLSPRERGLKPDIFPNPEPGRHVALPARAWIETRLQLPMT